MPEGPPPGAEDPESGSDDDIPMPEGPPPGNILGSFRTQGLSHGIVLRSSIKQTRTIKRCQV